MPELEYWKIIAEADIPGLTIDVTECRQGYTVTVIYGDSFDFVPDQAYDSYHRAAAMLVVDGRRAQGWLFSEEDKHDADGYYTLFCLFSPEGVRYVASTRDHDGKEHLALLALLSEVVK